ncbi:hypothetical protein R3P38DRAFT_3171189 [Favolaschia claudopus]|uniref:Uncharacterized protein n=1 Tax=Favolaschia claudopus TaxID=2862362 RepID=A0AAW0DM73_9AGAR
MSIIDQYAPPRRRYLTSELEHLTRSELVDLIMQEPLKWPKNVKGTFSKHKTNMQDMRWALSICDFTTDRPVPPQSSSSSPTTDSVPNQPFIPPHAGPQLVSVNKESTLTPPPSAPNTQGPLTEDISTTNVSGSGSNSVLINAPLLLDKLSRVRSLILLITDTRNSFNIEKATQRISLPAVSLDDCKPGEWRVDAKELVAALQAAICAFEGSARLGTPNEDDQEFIDFFGVARHGEVKLFNDTSHLLVPANGKLSFRIAKLQVPKQAGEVNSPPSRSEWAELQDHIKHQARLSPSPAATKPATSDALAKFLIKWEKEHPGGPA